MRITATNPWGTSGGLEPQRADLWLVDLSEPSLRMNQRLSAPTRYFATSIRMPEQVVRGEPFRRDSQPRWMPTWDEPLAAITISFIHDVITIDSDANEIDPSRSQIYQLLNRWRSAVRAGRGLMYDGAAGLGSATGVPDELDSHYSADFQFNIDVILLKGVSLTGLSSSQTNDSASLISQEALDEQMKLQESSIYRLKNAWLSQMALGEMVYDQVRALLINTTFFAEEVVLI